MMLSVPLRNTQHPPQSPQQPTRSGSHRHGDTTALKRRVGPVDGPPQHNLGNQFWVNHPARRRTTRYEDIDSVTSYLFMYASIYVLETL